MSRYVSVVGLSGDILAVTTDEFSCAPFVEDVIRRVVVDAYAISLCDGADKNAVCRDPRIIPDSMGRCWGCSDR